MKRELGFYKLLILIFFFIVAAIMLFPVIKMVLFSFQTPRTGEFTLDNYVEIFTSNLYTAAFRNSIVISLVSSLFGLIVTTIATYAVVSWAPKLREAFLVLANLSNNFVGISLAFGFILLFGNAGILTVLNQQLGLGLLDNFTIYSMPGLLIVFIYFQIPLGITLIIPIFDALEKNWRESAEILGANTIQFWLRIGLPVLAPHLVAVFSIMFANAMGAYDTAVALTGAATNLVSIRIASTVSGDIFAKPEIGSAVAVILGLTLAFSMIISRWLGNRIRRDIK